MTHPSIRCLAWSVTWKPRPLCPLSWTPTGCPDHLYDDCIWILCLCVIQSGLYYSIHNQKNKFTKFWSFVVLLVRLDLEFSRGGLRIFQKKNLNFAEFFQVDQIDFPNTRRILWTMKTFCPKFQNLWARGNIFEKKAKNAFLGTFWKISIKKSRFFHTRSPSKLFYIGAKGSLR